MKKTLLFIVLGLFLINYTDAQLLKIHKKDSVVLNIPVADIDSITFDLSGRLDSLFYQDPLLERIAILTSAETVTVNDNVVDLPDMAKRGSAYYYPKIGKGRTRLPVVMVPGLGLDSYMFVTTPDGRDGWIKIFAESKHPSYVYEEPRYMVHEGIDYSGVVAEDIKIGDPEASWSKWGMGLEYPIPYDNTQYPVDYYSNFASSFPQYTSFVSDYDDAGKKGRFSMQKLTQQAAFANLTEFLDTLAGAIIIAHSWAGILCTEICTLRPDLVHAIVMYEPVGVPDDSTTIVDIFQDIPFLGLYGDYIVDRGQDGRKESVMIADSVLQSKKIMSRGDPGLILTKNPYTANIYCVPSGSMQSLFPRFSLSPLR